MRIFNVLNNGFPYGFLVGFIAYSIGYVVHILFRVFDPNIDI